MGRKEYGLCMRTREKWREKWIGRIKQRARGYRQNGRENNNSSSFLVRNSVEYLLNCKQGDLHFWYSFRNDTSTLHNQVLSGKLPPEGIKIIITR